MLQAQQGSNKNKGERRQQNLKKRAQQRLLFTTVTVTYTHSLIFPVSPSQRLNQIQPEGGLIRLLLYSR